MSPPRRSRRTISAVLRQAAPKIAEAMAAMAEDGSVPAAKLVMQLLGNVLEAEQEGEHGPDRERTRAELERELRSLPPDIAAEIVGLLAKAGAGAAGPASRQCAPAHGAGEHSLGLPSSPERESPDPGEDAL